MGNKFLITLCLAVLLQDSMGSLANRSYNPRFRNVNKKYLKAESENGFEDREITQELLSNADVILVSLPEENSANELPAYQKENRNHLSNSIQHKPKKPNHSSLSQDDSPVIHQNKPLVLQLLGWTGNPPPPIAVPSKESEVDTDNIAVPIVIKEEWKPESESSMIGSAQENKEEWSQKPEAEPVVVVEEKIMNEEPTILIKEEVKPEASMIGLAQENKQEWSQKPEAMPVVVVEEKIMNEAPIVVIKEELKPEASMVESAQENKQEWSQKPEAMPVVVVEEKIMNEEPTIVIKEELKPEGSMIGSAQENKQEWSQKPEAVPVVLVEEKIMNEEPVIVVKEEWKPEASMVGSAQENKQEWIQKPEAIPVVVVEEKIMNEEPSIVIKEELKPEGSMIGSAQENKEEWIQKPESIPVVVVEEKIMNEEPSVLIADISEDKKETIASENWAKPTEIKNDKEASIMLETISESAPLIIEPISKPLPEVIEIEDKKESSKTKPQKIEDAIIADMKLNLFGAGMKKKESASIAAQEPTIVYDLLPENLLVMSDASISEMLDSEDKKEVSKHEIEIISEKIDSQDMKIQSSDDKILAEKPAKEENNEKVIESVAAISEIMSEANKDSMPLGEEIKIAMDPALPESIIVVDSVPEMAFPMADNKDKMESKPEEIVMQAPMEVILMAAENSFPMAQDNNKKVSKPVEIVMQETPIAEISSQKVEEIPMAVQEPIAVAIKESPVAESSFPMTAEKDKIVSKPQEITMQLPLKVVVKENSAPQSSSPIFQNQSIESKLDSKIPDEKLKPSQKFPSVEQEAQLLTAAKPALSENPEKVIVLENSLINNTRTRPSKKPRPSRPNKKPSKKPAKPTVAATTTVAPTTLGVSVGLDK